MEEKKELDFSKISAEEITDAKYSPDDFANWRKFHREKNDTQKQQDDNFLEGFNKYQTKGY